MWDICCDPDSSDVATLYNLQNQVSMILGDRDYISVSNCETIDACNGADKWRLHSGVSSVQLELVTAPHRFLASVFTARLTKPIDETSRIFQNTFLTVNDIEQAACERDHPAL